MIPAWLRSLLGRVVPDSDQDEVIGDLEELHRRRLLRRGRWAALAGTTIDGLFTLVRAMGPRSGARPWALISVVEVRLALRLLVKQPVMTFTSIVALGLGIGIAAGGASVFRQVLYSDLPFQGGERWALVETYDAETGRRTPLELERLQSFRQGASAVEYVAGVSSATFNVLYESGELERVEGASVTPEVFRYLPYVPVAGRLLTPDDGAAGAPPTVLIRESLWERRFSRSPLVIGGALNLSGEMARIVGVLGDDATYPSEGEIWVALDESSHGAVDDRDGVGSRQIAILAEGATAADAESQLAQLSDGLATPGRGLRMQRHRVTPFTDIFAVPGVHVVAGTVVAVLVAILLVIAANVANLVVARTSRRSAELSVRAALGASRARLVSQLFVEALVLGLLAAGPGLALAWGILDVYDRLLDEMPFWMTLALDGQTVVVVLVLSLLASALMGIVPAFRATGRHGARLLRGAGRGGRLGVGRGGAFMIVTEVALSVALLGAGARFARGFEAYVTPVFHLPDDQVLSARIALEVTDEDLVEGGAATVADSARLLTQALLAELSTLPAVQAVAVGSHLPRVSPYPEPIRLEGSDRIVRAPLVQQGVGLFSVLDVEPALGRGFEVGDTEPGASPVAVVNQAFALEHYGTTQVLGRRVRVVPQEGDGEQEPWREIVGVVPNVMEVTGLRQAAGVYLPFVAGRSFYVALRVEGDPRALTQPLRRTAFELDPGIDVQEVVALSGVGAENKMALGAMSSAASVVGLVTLLLSLAGIYSIVSLAVSQRTREIGVRVALGAEPRSILWSISRRSGLLVAAGGLVGGLLGFQLSKLSLFTFVVPEGGPGLFLGLVLLMSLSAVVACWIPARRALSIQPVEAMRSE